MKRSRYSETRIISILKEAENGLPIAQPRRKYGMNYTSFYNWRTKYAGIIDSMVKRVMKFEEENRVSPPGVSLMDETNNQASSLERSHLIHN